MINYYKGIWGVNLLFRVHGSAVYRAMVPGIFSVAIYLWIVFGWRENQTEEERQDLGHPYAIGVLVSSVTFLIVFRVSQGYGRYWEATGAIFHMMSKWLDATTHTGCYHMQQDHYDKIKPPSFHDYPELDQYFLTRDRERGISHASDRGKTNIQSRAVRKSINVVTTPSIHASKRNVVEDERKAGEPLPLTGPQRLDGGWGKYFDDGTATFYDRNDGNWSTSQGFASEKGGRTPPLFLQELAHLSSLMCAVALSTVRNDMEGAESPLDVWEPGAAWPEVDPDKMKERTYSDNFFDSFRHLMGADRTPYQRTKYNASRPLPVLGGVSDAEIRFLQMARGPSAKTQLCWNWLSEFIIREHLAGSTGAVGPPIISRIIQFLGDGMIYYNHCRKVMFIPFPFAHAQLSVFYVLVMIGAVPFLMDQYTSEKWLGACLTFFTVTCLAALHEVSRELENPFRNVPNELPLVTLQAMYNESLITMFAGYHPDAFWDPSRYSMAQNSRNSLDASLPDLPESMESIPESPPPQNGSDMAKMQKLIETQGEEIERLRQLMEGSKKKSK